MPPVAGSPDLGVDRRDSEVEAQAIVGSKIVASVPEQEIRLTTGSSATAAYQRGVEALGFYIDLCMLQVDGTRVHRVGSRIAFVLFLSALNRACAVQNAALNGYAHEAEPTARSLLNVGASFVYLASRPEAELDGYAYLYWLHAESVGLDRADRLETTGRIDAARAAAMKAEITALMDEHRRAAAAAGITVAPKAGNRKDTWTGLSDYDLLSAIGATGWYDLYYRYLSSGMHVDGTTIADDLRTLARGTAGVGPRYRFAFGVLRITAEVLHGCMLAFHTMFGTGELRAIDQAKAAVDRELEAFMRTELELIDAIEARDR